MIGVKRFWVCTIIECSLLFSFCATYAKYREMPWQQVEKYEIKSGIINFNYTEMGYPVKKPNFGIPIESDSKLQPPRKLVKDTTEKDTNYSPYFDGMSDGAMVFVLWLALIVVFFFIIMVLYFFSKKMIDKKQHDAIVNLKMWMI